MKSSIVLLLLVGTIIIACGTAAPSVAPMLPLDEIDLSQIACREGDFPNGWVFTKQIREVPEAVFLSEEIINYHGVTFEGPDDFSAGCHLMIYETEDSAQRAYDLFAKDAASFPETVPIKAIGDEETATMNEFDLGILGHGVDYGVIVRKGPFILNLRLGGPKHFSLQSLDALLEAVVARIPN